MRYSFARILILTSILLVLVGIILTFGVSFGFYQYNFNKTVQEKTHILKIISDAVAGPLLTFREPMHPLVIENVLQKSLEVPGVMFVRSFNDANKTIIISSDPKETGIKIENLPALKREISVRDGIFNGEKIKEFSIKARDGTNLWMGFSFKDIEKDILINAVVLGVSASFLIIITILVIFFIFRHFLITPFLSLTTAFEKLKNKDYGTRLADSPVSEIQKIFQSFNEMVQNLSNSYQSLKMAETETKKSEKLFRSFLDSAPLCIKWFDKDGNLISINKNGREEHYLEGKMEEEIKNWKYLDSIDEAYRPMVKEKMDSALMGETSSFEMKHVVNGSREQWCAATITPVKNDEGDISNILFISRGLSKEKIINEEREKNIKKTEETKSALFNILEDIKESERKFQEERDRSQAIISSMGEGLVVIDKNYMIVMANKTAESLLEIPAGKMIGRDTKKIVSILKGEQEIPDDERPEAKTFKTGETIIIRLEDNYYLKLPSGKKFPVEIISAPLRGDGITAAVVIFQDISKEKSLDEAKNSFISIASHQLRTPLTSIRWYAEMLGSEDAGPLNENQKNFVSRVYGSALKLNEVINLLLSLARIESGKTGREISKIDLIAFTDDITKELEPQFKQKNISVALVPPTEKLAEIKYDVSMLRQIVTNLLSNSIRYTENNGKIEIKIEKREDKIIYSVKDDGIGIPADQQGKIFQKFFRADNTSTAVPDGSGLGLALVRALIEMNNGSVWFESPTAWTDKSGKEEKKGTAFYFTINS